MDLGNRIKQLRAKSGLTQEQLGMKLGIGAQAVSKWENSAAMPDITLLPSIAEVFGVTVDDLFDLTAEQRLNRIENRLDAENELPSDVFYEYKDYLKSRLTDESLKKRSTELLAFLYWHRMNSYAEKVRSYAKEAIRMSPSEKGCQWMLQMAEGHAAWDWNISNHGRAVDFYRQIADENPDAGLPYLFLLDNLLADRRADEAERVLERYASLPGVSPVIVGIYRAHIALARFDEQAADRIIEELGKEYPDDDVFLFEAAQYYAGKCGYDKAIEYYERSFELDPQRPRFQDALKAIADIYEIRGDYANAAITYDRIIGLLESEWGMTDESVLLEAKSEKARLLEKSRHAK